VLGEENYCYQPTVGGSVVTWELKMFGDPAIWGSPQYCEIYL
jgi:hypothetical protein